MSSRFRASLVLALAALAAAAVSAQRTDVFVESRDHPAIRYSTAPTANAVDALNRRLEAGEASLRHEPAAGYLRSLLDALELPVSSQALVFSQTSFQAPLINIHNPRAIYFNDTVSVGWVRGGDVLEISAFDPTQGVVFYTLDQERTAKPRLQRNNNCLACHLSWETLGVPGLIVQSVHPLPDKYSYVNGYTTVHGSPLNERWGGWWVTGDTGNAPHMGNIPVMPDDKGKSTLANPRRPLASVEGLFDLKGFPSAHSDVVAQMVLAHQTRMTNIITRTGWEARLAAAAPSGAAAARVRESVRELVDTLLMVDEAPLTGPMKGSTSFAADFAARGPRDRRGRSLRDLDLQRRVFKYPLSYMIYSEAFDALPVAAREQALVRLHDVLAGRDPHPRYTTLTPADRRAIVEILRETTSNLPASFTPLPS